VKPPVPSLEGSSSFWPERERLVQLAAAAALVWGGVYLVWRAGWSGSGASLLLFLTLFAAEVFGWVSLAFYVFLAWRVPRSVRPALPATLPSVDVFVCTYDEPAYVLQATLIGCREITVPHTTYLLDDGARPELAPIAARLGAVHVTRPDNSYAKAGNINHALPMTHGELILFLDADHVPRPDILEATVGYFSDLDVALVQTPHDFSNRDSAQHTSPVRHEQKLFYDVIAPGKNRHNAMFWCGSATIVRRDALAGVGGVLTNTIAEDFHTTIAMHARGWRTRYHDEILVQGLAPHDLAGFLLQRARWARGNLGVFRTKQNPLTCYGLTRTQRLSYLASLANYFNGLQRLALLSVLGFTLATGQLPMHASIPTLAALWLPWALLGLIATVALGRGTLAPLDSTRYGLLTMGIQIRGVLSLFVTRAGPFRVTPKHGVDKGGVRIFRMLGLLTTVGGALLIVWALRVAATLNLITLPPMPDLALAVTLTLGVWELGCIAVVLTKAASRGQLRGQYRFPVELRARIARTSTVVPILDLTPDGIAFSAPIAIDSGTRLELLTRLPDTRGRMHDLTIPIEVRSSVPTNEDGTHRIGSRFINLDNDAHAAIVEYCFVAQPAEQLGAHSELVPDHAPTSHAEQTANAI
jgi:cellulose synthase (UDP-forming)